jgi:hypothetical protein
LDSRTLAVVCPSKFEDKDSLRNNFGEVFFQGAGDLGLMV